MRLDHLLSREKTQREIRGFIPRSMPSPAMELVKEEPQGSQELRNVFQSLCIIFRVRRLSTASRATRPPRTLTTVYEGRDLKDQIISVQEGGESRLSEKKRMVLGESTKNQANKSTGRMPRHHTPKKDVASCDKLRGAASRH